MKKSHYSQTQIVSILKEGEVGIPVDELCRKYGIGHSTYYKWKSKYGGLEISELRRLKQLEEENRRLKTMYAKACLEKEILQEALEGKL
jgi:putative transposase